MSTRNFTTLVAFAVVCACWITDVPAAVISNGSAKITFKITGYFIQGGQQTQNTPPSWLTATALLRDPAFQAAFGHQWGNASFGGFSSVLKIGGGGVNAGDGVELQSRTNATASPEGFADAVAACWALYDFTNTSAAGGPGVNVSYQIDWEWESRTTGSDPLREEGWTLPQLRINNDVKGIATYFPPGDTKRDSDSYTGAIGIPAGQHYSMSLSTSSGSNVVATSNNPEPSTALVLVAGGLMTFCRQRRRST